jgi:enolase-phosphatase E1
LSARAILLDVEGTTTPVAFVHDVLFGYAREHVEGFLRAHWEDAGTRADATALRAERSDESDGDLEGIVAYVHELIRQDRKSTALKSLQGRIWEAGYRDGTLVGQVYPDVPPALSRWRRQGRDTCIFSSGSVLSQRLLFSHTEAGDLTPYLRDYFDTTTGPKRSAGSYAAIAESLDLAPAAVLFISDVVAELDAAREAGMDTRLCVRDGAEPQDAGGHDPIRDFDEVFAGRYRAAVHGSAVR